MTKPIIEVCANKRKKEKTNSSKLQKRTEAKDISAQKLKIDSLSRMGVVPGTRVPQGGKGSGEGENDSNARFKERQNQKQCS